MAAAARTGYRSAAGWFAVAVIGQAAALRMIDAGPRLHYQHYVPLSAIASTHPWLLAMVVLQTVGVAIALARYARGHGRERFQRVGSGRLALALLLSTCTAAVVSAPVSRYLTELTFAAFLQVLSIATMVVMVLAIPAASLPGVDRVLRRVLGDENGDHTGGRSRRDRFGWTAALVATVLAAVLNVVSYERHPHVPDEVVYLYHARYFADGRLSMPAPPVAAAFDLDLMNYEPTRWFSPVPPGWPAALAVGVLAGVPWLVNPVLAGLNVVLTYVLLGHLYSRRVARYATALLAASPWFLFLAMSFMTHMSTLTCALIAAIAVVYARRAATFGWGALAGSAVGAASLVRPLDGVIVGVLVALWSVGVGGRRLKLVPLAGLVLGTLVVGALAFPYNRALTGHPLTFPINAYLDKYHHPNSNAYGFGPDRGMGWPIDPNPGHGPLDGLINANLNVFGINTDLFGWSTGSLIFVAWLLCSGGVSRVDRSMATVIVVIFIAYFFYYFSGGPDFGARYWFPMIVPLVALTGRGIETMERLAGARVGLAVAALVAMTLINYVPWRAIDKYHHFRGMRADMRSLAADHGFARDVVLVRGERFPDYASAAIQNPIDLTSSSTIYAWDRSADVRRETLRAYPDRRVWLVDGPSITGTGYRVAKGPMSAIALMSAGTK